MQDAIEKLKDALARLEKLDIERPAQHRTNAIKFLRRALKILEDVQ